ncbi:MAG: hypothetical protein LBG04_02030 [Holosporaceae bacterium]|jgi:hypothetical protein|nr:hypothetical protein [Holosporaceae bacterium]
MNSFSCITKNNISEKSFFKKNLAVLFLFFLVSSFFMEAAFCMLHDPKSILTQNLISRINGGVVKYLKDGKEIYDGIVFSKGGREQGSNKSEQPSISICVKESWAMHGIDPSTGFSNPKDPVTQWYCEQFLPSHNPINELKVTAGIRTSIINFDESMSAKINQFVEIFQMIASNPVGRILLYRILIEIHRNNGQGQGTVESCIDAEGYSDELIHERNNSRTLLIHLYNKFSISTAKLSEDKLSWTPAIFNFSDASIFYCNQSILGVCEYKVFGESALIKAVKIGKAEQPAIIPVFHELIHWLHSLRDIRRKKLERTKNFLDAKTLSAIYYFGFHDEPGRRNVSSSPWGLRYNQEEHRTICGIPHGQESPLFYYGDELFENLFIASIGSKFCSKQLFFRHGHSETGLPDFYFFEDENVIKRELDNVKHWGGFIGIVGDSVRVLGIEGSKTLRGRRGLGSFFFPDID